MLATARLFVSFGVAHPFWMLGFLVLTAVTFSLFGFIIGIWADGFEKLQIIPLMIITPLTFLGGTFYSIKMLPPFWQSVTLLNPVVYLVSGFRWAFYGVADVSVGVSAGMTLAFLALCLVCVRWIFKTGTGSRPEPGGAGSGGLRSSLSGGRLRGAGQAAVRVQQPFAPGMDGVVRRQ